MTDYYKMVIDKEAEFTSLWARMDKDKDLCVLKEYVWKDTDGREVPDIDNITLNDSAVFGQRVESTLNSANMQIVVEGENLKDEETTLVENFAGDILASVDERLRSLGLPGLMAFNVQQICYRGGIATRSCLRIGKDGRLVPDVLPLDMRYVSYDLAADGLKWVAYKTYRTKEQIEDEYDLGGREVKGPATVRDLWDDEYERVLIEKDVVKEEKHKYGKPPLVIQLAPAGLYFGDSDRMEHMGESIFAANRNLYAVKNKLGTILTTLTVMSFNAGLQYESQAGLNAPKPKEPPYGKRFVVPVEQGGGYKPMPVQDVKNAARWLYQMVESGLQRGSLPAASYGNLTFPLSAIAIQTLTQAEDPVYLPRLQGLALYYQRLLRMLIKQYIALGKPVEVGESGKSHSYAPIDLDKDYSIGCKFFATSPAQTMANYALADVASRHISEDTVARKILQLENPSEESAKRLSEMADRLVPALGLYKMAKAKLKQGEEAEAKIIAQQLGLTLQQLKTGGVGQKPERKQPGNGRKPIMPLMGSEAGGMMPGRGGRSPVSEEGQLEEALTEE